MDKMIPVSCILLVALVLIGSLAVMTAAESTATPQYNKAAYVAKQFTVNEGTYKFDGMAGTLKVVPAQNVVSIMGVGALAAQAYPDTYTFKISFDSSHAGYGNRAGMILAESITPHTALITVKNNKVISATMDGKWNMMTEKPL